MAQVINEYRGLGNALGEGLGQGFGESLKQLAQHKIDALKSQYGENILSDIGIDPLSARFINAQPAKQRAGLVADYFRKQEEQNAQAPANEEPNRLQDILEPSAKQEPQQMGGLAQLFNNGLSGGGINPQLLQQLQQMQQQQQAPRPEPIAEQPQPVQAKQEKLKPVAKPHDILKKALAEGKSTAKTADQELKERKQNFTEQQSLNSFLTKEQEDYKVNRQITRKAQEALDILRSHSKDWPGAFKGNLSEAQRALLIRDPNVREYAAKIAELVILKGQARKGLPSNFKLKLEEMAKANLNQPIKTQENILESMINDASDSEKKWEFIVSNRDDKGNYPLDLKSRSVEFDMAMDNPLAHPHFFEEGTVVEDRGLRRILRNGKWVKE